MNEINRKTLAVELIANDIVNSKLIYGLNDLNIDASTYSMFLETPILSLIGYSENLLTLAVHDQYAALVRQASKNELKVDDYESVRTLAFEIYEKMSLQLSGLSANDNHALDDTDAN